MSLNRLLEVLEALDPDFADEWDGPEKTLTLKLTRFRDGMAHSPHWECAIACTGCEAREVSGGGSADDAVALFTRKFETALRAKTKELEEQLATGRSVLGGTP